MDSLPRARGPCPWAEECCRWCILRFEKRAAHPYPIVLGVPPSSHPGRQSSYIQEFFEETNFLALFQACTSFVVNENPNIS